MKGTFTGKRALILGGSCELALTLAQSMIEASLYPILTYRSDRGLQAISESMLPFAGRFESHYLNFGERETLDTLFTDIAEDLDVLIDFVNDDYESLVASADEDMTCRYFTENVSFRAWILKRAGRAMLKKRKGRLIYISSTAAERPNPGQGFYAAAKRASEALYLNMGLEMAGRGITVAILRPGYVNAGRGAAYIRRKGKAVLDKVPTNRAITREQIAHTILFLLSDGGDGINGTVVTMDGGLTSGK
ncbi:MAG: SDR family oxidoreductase [Syntrophales bacterium]|nr:SDR family oxidoreductase [Syntrophales bacterium]